MNWPLVIAALAGGWAAGFVCAICLRWLCDRLREIEAGKHPGATPPRATPPGGSGALNL
jgi:hypothetical protein